MLVSQHADSFLIRQGICYIINNMGKAYPLRVHYNNYYYYYEDYHYHHRHCHNIFRYG